MTIVPRLIEPTRDGSFHRVCGGRKGHMHGGHLCYGYGYPVSRWSPNPKEMAGKWSWIALGNMGPLLCCNF